MDRNLKNIDFLKIEAMVEDDVDFRNQLLDAIKVAVEELEEVYLRGISEKDPNVIKMSRHKIKPTLGLFDLQHLAALLAKGKRLMAEKGFNEEIELHKEEFRAAAKAVLDEIKNYR
jgi:phage terminase Nu1 subunit (DNA packaging protein)